MSRSMPFIASALLIVLFGTLMSWPFLGGEGRIAILWAGLLVVGTQIPVHLLLNGWRARADKFVHAIVAGFVARGALLVVAVVVLVIPGRVSPAPFLLGLGAFLVATLFVESILEQRRIRTGGEPAKA